MAQRDPRSVLRDWVQDLTLQMQGTLLTAVRGPDNVRKHHPIKALIRPYRACILNNARGYSADPEGNTFAGDGSQVPPPDAAALWEEYGDELPHHWRMHFLHCAQIIGFQHPDPVIGQAWVNLYLAMCHDLHLEIEPEETMRHRLRGDGVPVDQLAAQQSDANKNQPLA